MSFRDEKIIRPVWPFALNHNSPQAQGLIMWWPMATGGGHQVIDFSGKHSHGTISSVSSIGWGESVIGNTLRFSGAAGYVSFTPQFAASFTEASFSVWIKNNTNVQFHTHNTVVNLTGNVAPHSRTHYPYSDGFLYIDILRNDRLNLGNIGLDKSRWHLLTVTTKPGSNGWRIFQNGNLLASNTGPASISLDSATAYLGAEGGGSGYYYAGEMADVRIWDRALSDSEVLALYDPQTRYDLYWELGRRAWFLPPATQAITPNAISQAVAVPNPTITPGAVTIAPSLLTQSVAVPNPTITPGQVTIAPSAISQTVAIQQPTIAPGAVTVAPSLLTQAISIPNPTVGQAGGGAALALSDAAVTLVTVSDTLLTV